ncbi:MAG: alpha/beta fold hydrolase [Candidatus Binatia bacterium]|nr:alpha/beta fold hydrolase [Candidatus Binatia bacterium]
MPKAHANGIEVQYETFGDRGAEPLLILRGLSTQLIHWDPDFCRGLADRGHFVVIFDNRDVGETTWFDEAGVPDLGALIAGEEIELAYRLDDMADDTVGLMDALEIQTAHIAGISMGGMIVQTAAVRHPSRVRSLTSVMSSTGGPELPPPSPEAMHALIAPAPEEREAYVAHTVQTQRVIGSPGFPFDAAREADVAGRAFDRAFHPAGAARQLAAVQAQGDRREKLRALDVPTLVIHGSGDPLIPLAHGQDTASVIPGAELRVIEGMGHDIPRGAHGELIGAIGSLTARVDGR